MLNNITFTIPTEDQINEIRKGNAKIISSLLGIEVAGLPTAAVDELLQGYFQTITAVRMITKATAKSTRKLDVPVTYIDYVENLCEGKIDPIKWAQETNKKREKFLRCE